MKVKVTVTDSYDAATNRSTVTLSSVNVYSSANFGLVTVYGKITLNGTVVADFEGGASNTVVANTSYNACSYSGTYGSVVVAHDSSGAASVAIGVAVSTTLPGSGVFGINYQNDLYGVDAATQSVALDTQAYTLTTGYTPSGYGSVTAGGQMAPTSTKSLTATPAPTTSQYSYSFKRWMIESGNGELSSLTANPTTFTMRTSNTTVLAVFERTPRSYTVTVNAGANIASVSGGGSKAYGSSVTVTAVLGSATGYTYAFDGWYNGSTKVSSSLSYTFTMGDSAITLTAKATRTANSHTVSVSAGTNIASVSGGGTYTYGSSVTVTAVLGSATGYTYAFDGWYNGANKVSSSLSYTFAMGDANLSLTAKASRSINSYTVSLTAGSFIASVSGGGSKTYGSSVAVTAALGSATGYSYSFDGWYNGSTKVSSSLSYTFTMPANGVSLTAKAARSATPYTLLLSADVGSSISVSRTASPYGGGELGTLTNGSVIYYNDELSVSFSAQQGYEITSRKINGNAVASTVTYTVVGGTTIEVTSQPTEYALSLTTSNGVVLTVVRTASPIGGGSIGQLYNNAVLYYNDQLTITYSKDLGYSYDQHTANGDDLSSGDTFVVSGDLEVIVTASASGIVYIDGVAYNCQIDNGAAYALYQAYIDTGTAWVLY
jgi:hypothetical protein